MIIDFHTHPFIRKECNSCFYDGVVNDMADFEKDIYGAGIDMWCGSVIQRVDDFESIHRLNLDALELAKKYKGKYIPGVHIHPNYVEQSAAELEAMAEKGVKLVGELVPYYNGWEHYYDENMHEIYKVIDRLGMIVSLHTPCDDTLEEAIKLFPNITFVCAHPRDHAYFEQHLHRLKTYDNCYIDISGTGLFRWGMLETLVNEVGSEKILFGTDYPITNPRMYVNAVDYEHISTEAKENIYCNNAKRLLNI